MRKLVSVTALSTLLMACSAGKTDTPTAAKNTMQKVAENSSASYGSGTTEIAMATKTSAVLVYADWCGSCKILDPAVKKVQSMGAIPGVDFVVLDYTDKDAENFYLQAQVAGVEQAVKTYLDGTIKTGQLLLVDIDDQIVLQAVKKDMDAAQIATSIKEALAAS